MDKITEKQNPDSDNLDLLSIDEILYLINEEDRKISKAVRANIPLINELIEKIVEKVKIGGRLFYVGCGTSGRLGVLDASECPPTFSVDSSLVQGIIAGGDKALRKSVENAEDSFTDGSRQILLHKIKSCDTVIGISANGSAEFVHGALKEAFKYNALTALLTFNDIEKLKYVKYLISTNVGPEIIAGSTRLKAGTATKMILNMISTASMIKLNKVYRNYMVDLTVSNKKLLNRAINIISAITGKDSDQSKDLLSKSNGNVKSAIIMSVLKVSQSESLKLINKYHGNIRSILRNEVK